MNSSSLSQMLLLVLAIGITNANAQDDKKLIEGLEEHFQIYTLRPDRRTPEDRIAIRKNEAGNTVAEMSYWYSLKTRDPSVEVCNAYQWLLFGRGVYGKNVQEAFQKFKSLQQIQLNLFDMEETTKKGKKVGEILPSSKMVSYLKIGVDRSSLEKKPADWKTLKAEAASGKCAEIGSRYLDSRWFNQAYLRRGR